ncbi:hypothetical protein BS47DRAFT_1362024 [Hydnum rufescens UP504]|uniref:Uncharacterized protein n=1 Tax=Hydnum rufescens UP504 TaxID=1448309 RepID=A0A9P6AYD5_9AGAM|nr:hypothetical protein BS47DRAFT_1362024 [Hydnum rufescens UP504]
MYNYSHLESLVLHANAEGRPTSCSSHVGGIIDWTRPCHENGNRSLVGVSNLEVHCSRTGYEPPHCFCAFDATARPQITDACSFVAVRDQVPHGTLGAHEADVLSAPLLASKILAAHLLVMLGAVLVCELFRTRNISDIHISEVPSANNPFMQLPVDSLLKHFSAWRFVHHAI